MVSPNDMVRFGVDLGGTKIEILALDDAGQILLRRRRDTPADDYREIVDAVAELVRDAERELGQGGKVGVGMPGSPSPTTGRIRNANTVVLNDQAFAQDLEAALSRPIRVANDANCFALSEAVDGAGAGAEVVFGVILGTGVGGGVVAAKRALSGRNAVAGEWGHNPMPWPTDEERHGTLCYCGKAGCIETFLSGPALALDYATLADRDASVPEIVAMADSGDVVALAAIERYEDRLARALASVINILDPDVIVLGGGVSNVERLYAQVPPRLARYVFSDVVTTPIVPPKHGDSSGARGAAWLWPPNTL